MQHSLDRLMARAKVGTVSQLLADKFKTLPEDMEDRLDQLGQLEDASPEEIDAWARAAMKAPSLDAAFQASPGAH